MLLCITGRNSVLTKSSNIVVLGMRSKTVTNQHFLWCVNFDTDISQDSKAFEVW